MAFSVIININSPNIRNNAQTHHLTFTFLLFIVSPTADFLSLAYAMQEQGCWKKQEYQELLLADRQHLMSVDLCMKETKRLPLYLSLVLSQRI